MALKIMMTDVRRDLISVHVFVYVDVHLTREEDQHLDQGPTSK